MRLWTNLLIHSREQIYDGTHRYSESGTWSGVGNMEIHLTDTNLLSFTGGLCIAYIYNLSVKHSLIMTLSCLL